MAYEIQLVKIAAAGVVGGLAVYYGKGVADRYLEIKALSAMPESYWVTEQKKVDTKLKITEVHEAAETKRHQETIKYQKEKDEKDRLQQLEVMEKEKSYPDSYWIYKTEKVKTESMAKSVAKKEETSLEKQKTIWKALTTGFDVFARRYSW